MGVFDPNIVVTADRIFNVYVTMYVPPSVGRSQPNPIEIVEKTELKKDGEYVQDIVKTLQEKYIPMLAPKAQMGSRKFYKVKSKTLNYGSYRLDVVDESGFGISKIILVSRSEKDFNEFIKNYKD